MGSKMKWIFQYIVLLCLGITVQSILPIIEVAAEEASDEKAPTGFIYKMQYPENQRGDTGYYDLNMTPGQQQTVQINLENSSDKEITVEVGLSGARTNSNGVIEYGPNKLEKDASLKFDFVDIVKGPEIVTIPPKSEKNIDLVISMPETSFDGVIVGGIQLKKKDDTEDSGMVAGANVVNKYAYIIAMLLQVNENIVTPDLSFNDVYAGQSNYRNVVFVDVSNSQAAFMKNLMMEVQVTAANGGEVLYEAKQTEMKMAPNSKLIFPVSMGGERMEAGKYKASILATSEGREWKWDKEFEITREQADKFNKQDLTLVQEKGINWLLVAGIVGALFIVIILIYIVVGKVRGNKKKKRTVRKRKQ